MRGPLTPALLSMLLLATGLHAQPDEVPDGTTLDRSLEICDKAENREEEGEYPCDEFIEANIEDHADAVRWLLDEIKNHEDDSVQSSNALYTRDQIVQWTLVALAFMLTITTTITQAYPKLKIRKIDFAMVPIALAAFSAAVTSLSVYYQFDDYRRLNQTVAYDLAELKSDIHFAVFRHAAASRERAEAGKINQDAINEWHERLDTILQRYLAHEAGEGG